MYIYVYIHIHINIYVYIHIPIYLFIGNRRHPGGGVICTIRWPLPPIGVVWGIFWGVIPNFAFNKAVPHGFEQSCSAMVTHKLDEKVQPHDEDAESSKSGCRSSWRAYCKAYEQVPALIYSSYTRRSFVRSCHLGGGGCSLWQNIGKKSMWARNLNLLAEISSSPNNLPPPIHNFGLCHQICMHIHIYIYVCLYVYIYMYTCM